MSNFTRSSFSRYRRLLTNALTDYRWALYYLQRIDYHPAHRETIGSAIAMLLPKSPSGNREAAATVKTVEQLQNNGFAPIDALVTPQQLSDIRAYLSTKVCYDPYHPEVAGFKDPSDAHPFSLHAYYRADDLIDLPTFFELANHPTILGSMEAVFGAKPTITKMQVWWLLHGFDIQANPEAIYAIRPGEFHRDADDWMQFKLYIYLTDVDETAGPHACIKGSHRWMLPKGERSLQFEDPSHATVENLQLFTGKAGLAWLENSYCLHRAIVAQNKHRLILTISYGLVPSPLWCGKATVPLDSSRFDPYVNRVFMRA